MRLDAQQLDQAIRDLIDGQFDLYPTALRLRVEVAADPSGMTVIGATVLADEGGRPSAAPTFLTKHYRVWDVYTIEDDRSYRYLVERLDS
jgi:hypothetical protein